MGVVVAAAVDVHRRPELARLPPLYGTRSGADASASVSGPVMSAVTALVRLLLEVVFSLDVGLERIRTILQTDDERRRENFALFDANANGQIMVNLEPTFSSSGNFSSSLAPAREKFPVGDG